MSVLTLGEDALFAEDVHKLNSVYRELQAACDRSACFEERMQLLFLRFSVEELARGGMGRASSCDTYLYCFYINQNGIRYLALSEHEALVAYKIKEQARLTHEEKEAALEFLRKLAL